MSWIGQLVPRCIVGGKRWERIEWFQFWDTTTNEQWLVGGGQTGGRSYKVCDKMLMAAGGLTSKVTGGLSAPLGDNPERGSGSL